MGIQFGVISLVWGKCAECLPAAGGCLPSEKAGAACPLEPPLQSPSEGTPDDGDSGGGRPAAPCPFRQDSSSATDFYDWLGGVVFQRPNGQESPEWIAASKERFFLPIVTDTMIAEAVAVKSQTDSTKPCQTGSPPPSAGKNPTPLVERIVNFIKAWIGDVEGVIFDAHYPWPYPVVHLKSTIDAIREVVHGHLLPGQDKQMHVCLLYDALEKLRDDPYDPLQDKMRLQSILNLVRERGVGKSYIILTRGVDGYVSGINPDDESITPIPKLEEYRYRRQLARGNPETIFQRSCMRQLGHFHRPPIPGENQSEPPFVGMRAQYCVPTSSVQALISLLVQRVGADNGAGDGATASRSLPGLIVFRGDSSILAHLTDVAKGICSIIPSMNNKLMSIRNFFSKVGNGDKKLISYNISDSPPVLLWDLIDDGKDRIALGDELSIWYGLPELVGVHPRIITIFSTKCRKGKVSLNFDYAGTADCIRKIKFVAQVIYGPINFGQEERGCSQCAALPGTNPAPAASEQLTIRCEGDKRERLDPHLFWSLVFDPDKEKPWGHAPPQNPRPAQVQKKGKDGVQERQCEVPDTRAALSWVPDFAAMYWANRVWFSLLIRNRILAYMTPWESKYRCSIWPQRPILFIHPDEAGIAPLISEMRRTMDNTTSLSIPKNVLDSLCSARKVGDNANESTAKRFFDLLDCYEEDDFIIVLAEEFSCSGTTKKVVFDPLKKKQSTEGTPPFRLHFCVVNFNPEVLRDDLVSTSEIPTLSLYAFPYEGCAEWKGKPS